MKPLTHAFLTGIVAVVIVIITVIAALLGMGRK